MLSCGVRALYYRLWISVAHCITVSLQGIQGKKVHAQVAKGLLQVVEKKVERSGVILDSDELGSLKLPTQERGEGLL